MGLLSKVLRTEPIEPPPASPEQATLICLKLEDEEIGTSGEREAIATLRDSLIRAVAENDAGEFDTLEFDDGFATISFTGSSADQLAKALIPLVGGYEALPGSFLVKRYGPPGAREQSVVLSAHA
jgi:hypothetical protein